MGQKGEAPPEQRVNIKYGITNDGRVVVGFSVPLNSLVLSRAEAQGVIAGIQEAIGMLDSHTPAASTPLLELPSKPSTH